MECLVHEHFELKPNLGIHRVSMVEIDIKMSSAKREHLTVGIAVSVVLFRSR